MPVGCRDIRREKKNAGDRFLGEMVMATSPSTGTYSSPSEQGQTIDSSAGLPWGGPPTHRTRLTTIRPMKRLRWPITHIALTLRGKACLNYRSEGVNHRIMIRQGSISIWPRGYEAAPIAWVGFAELLVVELEEHWLRENFRDGGSLDTVDLQHQATVTDRQLEILLRVMADEISAGCPTGRLYGQSLSVALVSCLACRYRRKYQLRRPPRCGLPQRDIQQILDYIDDHLGSNLTLDVLAGLVDLSPQHFCHVFHQAAGLTPHQYVIRRRIEKAKRLLDEKRLNIIDIALNLGFSNQSHFTQVFHRVTGTTPKCYQRYN